MISVFVYYLYRKLKAQLTLLTAVSDKLQGDLRTARKDLDRTVKRAVKSVNKSGDNLAQKIQIARQIEEKFEDRIAAQASEANLVAANSPTKQASEEERWKELQDVWKVTKDELDRFVAREITDGRTLRGYNNLSRKNYESIILWLFQDQTIDSPTTDALIEMNLMFNQRRNRRLIVEPADLVRVRELQTLWRNQLARSARSFVEA
jgi:hypothetical protein